MNVVSLHRKEMVTFKCRIIETECTLVPYHQQVNYEKFEIFIFNNSKVKPVLSGHCDERSTSYSQT